MFVKNNNGRVLLKLGLVLLILAAVGVAVFYRLQGTARVKLVKLDNAVDAVSGSVLVDADGGRNKELKSDAAGKVVVCDAIDVGKKFKEGDLLLKLDTTDLDRAMKELDRKYREDKRRAQLLLTGGKAEAMELLAKAKDLPDDERAKIFREVSPARKLAADKLEQSRRLLKHGNVSEEDVRNLERALEAVDLDLQLKAFDEKKADADYESNKANLQLQLDRMELKAPGDGEITAVFTWKGAQLSAGQIVGHFMSNTRIVTAKISEESFGKVRKDQPARVRLLTYGTQNFDAAVSRLLPTADDVQRFTVFLDVKVDDPEQLKPGSTGEVTITVDQHPNQVMIQRRALFDSDKVYVVKNGRVERRKVTVGFLALNVAEIRDGLAAGEYVIVDQLEAFQPGQRVRVNVVN
jgi:HlyD family secretion protein